MGHSDATYDQLEAAYAAGATMVTHALNAQRKFHHRCPSFLGFIATHSTHPHDVVYYGVIPDRMHLHDASLRVLRKCNFDGCVIVTDQMCGAYMEGGVYTLSSMRVEVKSGRAVLEGTDTLAGSVVTMCDAVKNYMLGADVTLTMSIACATIHPCRVMKWDDRGRLGVGMRGDFGVVDGEGRVMRGFRGGKEINWD